VSYTAEDRARIRSAREAPWQDPLDDTWAGVYVVRLPVQPGVDHTVPYIEYGEPLRRVRGTWTACGEVDPGEENAAPDCGELCPSCCRHLSASISALRAAEGVPDPLAGLSRRRDDG
jgi:hypothetical protein